MRKIYLFLLLILLLPVATADEVILQRGKTYLYKTYPLDFINIGSVGNAHIKVNQVSHVISYTSSTEIYGLKITLLEADSETIKINITQTAECLIDADCDDSIPCTKDYCELETCKYEKQDGCPINNQCKPKGSLTVVNEELSYCDGSAWHIRKNYKEYCENNYECLTNYCANNRCKALGYLRGGEKMAPAWILIILGILIALDSLLCVLSPKKAKTIYINLLKILSIKTYRIMGAVGLAIAAALIIWALI